MKKQLLILAALVLVLVSCRKEDRFYDDFDDDSTWVEDGQNDETYDDEGDEGSLTLYQVTEDEISKIKDFQVGQDLKPFQEDYAKHIKMWDFVTRLLPLEERDKIEQFEVFHGGGGLLGYVAPVDERDLSKWKFALAIDAADELDQIDCKLSLIHI